jgi:hypothetical protein
LDIQLWAIRRNLKRPDVTAVAARRVRDRRVIKGSWSAALIGHGRVRVGAPSHPVPYEKDLEASMLPGPAEIASAVRGLVAV